MNKSRKQVLSIAILVILALGVALIYGYFKSFQQVTIQTSHTAPGSTLSIYKKGSVEPIAKNISTGTATKLKKGEYTVVFSGSDYEKQDLDIMVAEDPQTITITPRYTKDKLGKMFPDEKAGIYSVINKELSLTTSTYEISEGRLYLLGEWFGGKIKQRQSAEEERQSYIDTFRVVLKKEEGEWKLLTNPPEIVVSHKKYPAIPRDILVDLNKNPESNN